LKNNGEYTKTREARLERAYELARFILEDGALSEEVAVASVLRLETVARAQDRRFYYKPTGRSHLPDERPSRFRNLIILNELHLLQSIVYDETEIHEKEIENNQKSIDEKKFLVHFIKHLVKITLKHNSFYVAIGLTRLLFNYSTAEAAEIYNLVIQDPSRVKDDYYWRSRKARLMTQIKDRFGSFLRVTRVSKGEERFVSAPDSARNYELVRECLNRFKPWGSGCPLPDGELPVRGEIESLSFNGADPDDEHQIEISRMHALMHSECFERIVAGLDYDAPVDRLELPYFYREGDRGDQQQQLEAIATMKLEKRELKELSRRIDDYHASRDQADPEQLRILVNGHEYGTLTPAAMKGIDLDLDDDADMVEVRTTPEAGNLLLATHYIDYGALISAGGPVEYVTDLKLGQKVTFTITPAGLVDNDRIQFRLGVSYGETNPLRVARLAWRRLAHTIGGTAWIPSLKDAFALRYALPALLALLTVGGVWLYIDQIDLHDESTIASSGASGKDISPPFAVPDRIRGEEKTVDQVGQTRAVGEKQQVPSSKPGGDRSTWTTIKRGDISTRSAETSGSTSLSGIRSLFIKVPGQSPEGSRLAEMIEAELVAANLWRIASDDEADAALLLAFEEGHVMVSLIDENSRPIWVGPRRYDGGLEAVARNIVGDLTAAVGKHRE